MRLRSLMFSFVLAAPLVVVAGCAQGQGERCQVTSDCATNLICVLPAGGSSQSGGTCQPQGGSDAGVVDMATVPDMTAAVDLGGKD